MTAIGRMLTRMIVARFLAILVGISLFVVTLEVVAYANEILALDKNAASILGRYFMMRLPGTMATFLPMSMLLAILLSLTELSYRNEIAAFWASGISPWRIIVMLLPLALMAGGLNFLLADQAAPAAAPQLREWGIADYGEKKLKVGERDPLWMRSGTDILRAESANSDSTVLEGVIVFRRDADGILREQIVARDAVLEGDRWKLSKVIVYYRDNLPPDRLDAMVYSGAMKPASAGARSGDPEEMTLADLSYFVENSGFGIRPAWVYETWWHKRATLFLTVLLMIAICIPLVTRFRRGGGIGLLFAAGVALGFVYFVIDGVSISMGELGFVPPWMAAWLPLAGFAGIAAAMGFRAERV